MEVFQLKTYDDILSYKYNFYKELYEDGVRQRNQINAKFSSTISLITVEITTLIWLVFKALKIIKNICKINKIELGIIVLLITTFILIFVSIIFFILCFTNYTWSYPNPDEAKSFLDSNKKCLKQYSADTVMNNILENISEEYIQMAIVNTTETNKHIKYLNKCYIFIVLDLIFLLADFIYMLMFSML